MSSFSGGSYGRRSFSLGSYSGSRGRRKPRPSGTVGRVARQVSRRGCALYVGAALALAGAATSGLVWWIA